MSIKLINEPERRSDNRLHLVVRLSAGEKRFLVHEAVKAELDAAGVKHAGIDKRAMRHALEAKIGADETRKRILRHMALRVGMRVADEQGIPVLFAPLPASHYDLEAKGLYGKEDWDFEIDVVEKPSYELESYEPVVVNSGDLEKASEEEVGRRIAEKLSPYARYENATGRVAEGDRILADMKTHVDGREAPELSGERIVIALERGLMPEGFVDNTVGILVGERRTFEFDDKPDSDEFAPIEHYSVDLRCRARRARILPELSDELVSQRFPHYGMTVAQFEAAVRNELEHEEGRSVHDLDHLVDEELAKRLVEPLPDSFIERRREELMDSAREKAAQQGQTMKEYLESSKLDEANFQFAMGLQARDSLRQGFALDALADHLSLQGSQEDMDAALRQMTDLGSVAKPDELKKNGVWGIVEESARRMAAHRWLVENVVIK